jgi:RNA polymerase sigma factor (sigma-70 family)
MYLDLTDERSNGASDSRSHDQRTHNSRAHTRLRHAEPATLLAAAARGDQRAWSLLVQSQSPMIRAIARRHRLSEADQDDVVQRTWLTLFRHAEEVRNPAALTGWLATTARRDCLAVLAASKREILIDEPSRVDDVDAAAPDETVIQRERQAALQAALNSLPCHQRELMLMLLAKPAATYDQLSTALGIPRGSIGPTRQRCIARLRRNPHLARVTAP